MHSDSTAGICYGCHADHTSAVESAAHNRSLTRIPRDANGHASAGAFSRMLNATLKTPRIVMVPLAGTISIAAGSAACRGVNGSR